MQPKKICIVGSGTAGLITALTLRNLFPKYTINLLSSKKIGIIGVGEGSTEHWRINFMDPCGIDVKQMVKHCGATHKYGIRFENWTNHTPDYFHSIGYAPFGPNGFHANYAYALENNWLLTASAYSSHLWENKIIYDKDNQHHMTNQFHFDTFKLNDYLLHLCNVRGIHCFDGIVKSITRNAENGFVTSVITEDNYAIEADFYIDASGFNRVIMSQLVEDDRFISYRKYLPTDSAAVFPTEPDESGQIKPYTRARALANGWMFEIPTQERRGNGYIFASDFCSDEQAIKELSEAHGKNIEPKKIIRYKSGYFAESFLFNCASVGLASSFVEPLEATSISTSIQQARMIGAILPTFGPSSTAQVKQYKRQFESLMDNILTMIALHYVSDRNDSEMWRAQQNAEIPETLKILLDLWKEKVPSDYDIPHFGYELFLSGHFWHVAQGQGVISKEAASQALTAYGSRIACARDFKEKRTQTIKRKTVDHASIFRS
jgi:tryptophan halogenase